MNFLKQLHSKTQRLGRTTKVFTASLLTLAVLSGSMVFAGWTPDRPTLDWKNPDDRKGSMDGPRMNAFINTPYYGDERAFFDARFSDSTGENERAYFDVLEDVTENETKQVVLRTYVHNGANEGTNDTVGMAEDAQVRITLPSGTANALRARSYISISNPAPGYPAEVTDTTELIDVNQKFSINYVEGSATLYNHVHENGVSLSDSIVTTGAAIGYEEMNGNLPGCFDYQAVVEITVEVSVSDLEIEKQVRAAGESEYGKFTSVNPGDKVEWLVRVQNVGDARIENIRVWDKLPPHVEVVSDSVRYIYRDTGGNDRDVVQPDDDLFENYVNFGARASGSGFFLRFDTKALDNFDGCNVTLRNVAYALGDTADKVADYADIEIIKDPCVIPVDDSLVCNNLSASRVSRDTFEFMGSASATGDATISSYVYDFGDGSSQLVTDQNTVEHTFEEDGTFVAELAIRGIVDGESTEVTSDACRVNVTVDPEDSKDEPEQPVDPERPEELPEQLPVTGIGGVAGLFAATSAISAFAHRVFVARRGY